MKAEGAKIAQNMEFAAKSEFQPTYCKILVDV